MTKLKSSCKCGKKLKHWSYQIKGKCPDCLAKLWIAKVNKRQR